MLGRTVRIDRDKKDATGPAEHLLDLDINPVDFFKNQMLLTPEAAFDVLDGCGSVPGGCTCGKAGCSCFYGSNT